MSGATETRRDLVARAFAFRRALTGAAMDHEVLAGCDGLLLSLILDLDRADTLRVVDAALAAALARAIGSVGPTIVPAGRPAAVTLLPFEAVPGVDDAHGGTVVVHDVPSVLPLHGGGKALALVGLNQISAATWRSRLALLCPVHDHGPGLALLKNLRGLLVTAELDPLFLLDALNARRGEAAPEGDAPDSEALLARCRSLETRVKELEMSGLARHQSLLADAALRRKFGS